MEMRIIKQNRESDDSRGILNVTTYTGKQTGWIPMILRISFRKNSPCMSIEQAGAWEVTFCPGRRQHVGAR